MTADITLRGPGDVVAVLPYQLGYHPRNSVVVVTLHGRRVGLVARADLPPDDQVGEVLASLTGPILREGAGSVIVVGFEDSPDASTPVLLALVEWLERAGLDVVDVAVVRDGRRYSLICSEPCCPSEGVALPHPADVPGVVELVGMGRAPLRSRGDVEGLVAPDPSRCVGVAAALESRDRMPRRRRRAAAAWRAVLAEGERGTRPPDGRVVADLALGLADVPWRDALIAWLAPSVLPAEALDARVVALMRSTLPTWAGMGLLCEGRQPWLVGEAPGHEPGHHGVGDVRQALDEDVTKAAHREAGGVGDGKGADERGRAGVDERGRAVTEERRRAVAEDRVRALADDPGRVVAGERGRVLAEERAELLRRLLSLCRSVPDECPVEAAAVCTVAAHVAWVGGDGALARAAVERALRLAPGYRLALLLHRLVDNGIRLPGPSSPLRGERLDEAG